MIGKRVRKLRMEEHRCIKEYIMIRVWKWKNEKI